MSSPQIAPVKATYKDLNGVNRECVAEYKRVSSDPVPGKSGDLLDGIRGKGGQNLPRVLRANSTETERDAPELAIQNLNSNFADLARADSNFRAAIQSQLGDKFDLEALTIGGKTLDQIGYNADLVKAFQAYAGITRDGVTGRKTVAALDAKLKEHNVQLTMTPAAVKELISERSLQLDYEVLQRNTLRGAEMCEIKPQPSATSPGNASGSTTGTGSPDAGTTAPSAQQVRAARMARAQELFDRVNEPQGFNRRQNDRLRDIATVAREELLPEFKEIAIANTRRGVSPERKWHNFLDKIADRVDGNTRHGRLREKAALAYLSGAPDSELRGDAYRIAMEIDRDGFRNDGSQDRIRSLFGEMRNKAAATSLAQTMALNGEPDVYLGDGSKHEAPRVRRSRPDSSAVIQPIKDHLAGLVPEIHERLAATPGDRKLQEIANQLHLLGSGRWSPNANDLISFGKDTELYLVDLRNK